MFMYPWILYFCLHFRKVSFWTPVILSSVYLMVEFLCMHIIMIVNVSMDPQSDSKETLPVPGYIFVLKHLKSVKVDVYKNCQNYPKVNKTQFWPKLTILTYFLLFLNFKWSKPKNTLTTLIGFVSVRHGVNNPSSSPMCSSRNLLIFDTSKPFKLFWVQNNFDYLRGVFDTY